MSDMTDSDVTAMTTTAEAILAAADELDQSGPEVPNNGLLELPDSVYHADPCERPSLTQSVAHRLLTRTPLHAWETHPRLGGRRSKSSKGMTTGTAIHELLLGGDRLQPVHADNYRTKKAKERRDELAAAGKVPMLKRELDELRDAAAMIRQLLLQRAEPVELGEGDGRLCEVAVFWETTATSGDLVQCRGKLDQFELIDEHTALITDLKLTRNAALDAIERSVDSYGYALQAAAYIEAIRTVMPGLKRVLYRWVFAEPEPPYAPHVCQPAGELLELGERRWVRAVNLWDQCMRTNVWPGHENVSRVRALPWAIDRELAAEAEDG